MEAEYRQLQESVEFRYIQAIGEIIYAYIESSTQILYDESKLSNIDNNLYYCHYAAIRGVIRYLIQETKKVIIWFKGTSWRNKNMINCTVGL